jgi:hypothetical protein
MALLPYDEAISMAIFAINTLMEPDASSDEDVDRLEAQAENVIETLADMRETLREMAT